MMRRHRWTLVAAALLVVAPLFTVALSVEHDAVRPTGTQVVEPWEGLQSRFADLDRLEDADLLIRLNFRDTALEKVFDSLEKTSGVRIDIDDKLPRCEEIDLGPVTLREALVHLAMKHDLIYDVENRKTLHVRTPRLAGMDGVSNPRLIPEYKVDPIYPEPERADRVEGSVVLQAVIMDDGSVSAIRPLREETDHPAFTDSAISAVSQWRYEPALLDGRPVEVFFTIIVEYSLR